MENGDDSILTYAEAFPPLATMTPSYVIEEPITTQKKKKKPTPTPQASGTTQAIPTSTITQVMITC